MEEEIDLRVYIDTLLRWWWLILLSSFLLGGVALLVSLFMPPVYEAKALVVSLRSRVDISLGSGFKSLTEDELLMLASQGQSAALIDRTKKRLNTLVGMVQSGSIAQRVANSEELQGLLSDEERDPAALLRMVHGELLEDSDAIQIVASNPDPIKAAAIANVWAREYERQVNGVYGEAPLTPFSDIQEQVRKARAEYDKAQQTWLTFLTDEDKIDELERQIAEEEAIVSNLRTARQTALSAVLNKEVQVRQTLIDAYLEDASTNRLFVFSKGQEAKRRILGTWIDSEVNSRIAVIERDRKARQELFNAAVNAEINARKQVFQQQYEQMRQKLEEYYARKDRLEQLLREARTMRQQLVEGGEEAARSNGLALLAFKSRVFRAADGLPFDRLDLQAASIDALNPDRSATEQIADLDALISAMEQEVAQLEADIQQQSEAMLNGEGYLLLDQLSPEYLTIAISPTLALTETTGISISLSDFIARRYLELFDVGEMARQAVHVATDTPLFAEIQKLYPELYTKDAWMELVEALPDETELSKQANQMADDLLKLKGLEQLLTTSNLEEPLSQEIARRELYIRELRAEVSRLQQRKQELKQERDLAWNAYSTLLSKAQEVELAAAAEGSEVRFVSQALPPSTPAKPNKKMNTVIGLAVGGMLGVFGAFLFEYLGLDNDPRSYLKRLKRGTASA